VKKRHSSIAELGGHSLSHDGDRRERAAA